MIISYLIKIINDNIDIKIININFFNDYNIVFIYDKEYDFSMIIFFRIIDIFFGFFKFSLILTQYKSYFLKYIL